MIDRVGQLLGRTQQSREIITQIKTNFSDDLYRFTDSKPKLQTIYLIWKDPYMTVGGDTFISNMLSACGFENIFENQSRYPVLSSCHLSTVNCQLCLLASEPYPFKEKHIEEIKQQLPHTRIILVDGEMFSWYGSRLQYAPAYFRQLRELIFNH
jgi:ABC-type Fe3+-hydroxamate transport system substrate-binding protein